MKALLLYFLKARHERALLKFHHSKYGNSGYEQDKYWERVMKWRTRIRWIEPDFLKGFD